MSNWWGNKLNAPAAPAAPPVYDPSYRQAPPPAPGGYQPPQPFGAPPQQQQQYEQPPQPYTPPDPGDPNGHLKRVWEYRGNPRGGAGDTMTLGDCPSCGSARYMSRSNTGGVMNSNTGQTVYPSPECADCGYPNQQGALAGSASATGPAMRAMQTEAPAPVGSLASLRQQS